MIYELFNLFHIVFKLWIKLFYIHLKTIYGKKRISVMKIINMSQIYK